MCVISNKLQTKVIRSGTFNIKTGLINIGTILTLIGAILWVITSFFYLEKCLILTIFPSFQKLVMRK